MKYWLLTSEFPPLFGGGISTYCIETVNMLCQEGYDVTVFIQDYSISKSEIQTQNDFRIVRFNPNKYFTADFLGYEANLSYAFAKTIQEYAEKEGLPDLVEAQEYMGIAYYLLQFKYLNYPLFKDLKVVITLHAPSFLYLEYNKINSYKFPYFWVGEMEKFCIRAADQLISPSAYLIDEVKSRMDIEDKIIPVVANPFKCKNEINQLTNKYNKNKIVFFGKLTPQKGCLELINYFKKIWEKDSLLELHMIGGGNHLYHPEGIDMIDFIEKKFQNEIQLGKLKLLGSIPPSRIQEEINDANIIVIPSTVDNLPYTVLEMMSLGKIVLASKQGGHSEVIINGVNGYLFSHLEQDSFEESINTVLSLNETQRQKISLNAIETIQKDFNYQTIYSKKKTHLNKLKEGNSYIKEFPYILPKNKTNTQSDSSDSQLLSVIVPYYNMGKYVDETIASIKSSNYKEIEIIIVNDGSNDASSIDILNKYRNQENISVIDQINSGLSATRNKGASYAKGKYLAFLDSDDTVTADYYQKAINALQQLINVSFVGCWANYFDENNGYWPAFVPEPPYLLVHNPINSSALVYKKEAFLAHGMNDSSFIYGMEDYDSVINLVKNGCNGVVLPEPLWNYRIRKNSMARQFTTEKELYLYRLISSKHKDFYSKHAQDVVNLLNSNGPGIFFDNPTISYELKQSGILRKILTPKMILFIKSQPLLRKIAITLKRFL